MYISVQYFRPFLNYKMWQKLWILIILNLLKRWRYNFTKILVNVWKFSIENINVLFPEKKNLSCDLHKRKSISSMRNYVWYCLLYPFLRKISNLFPSTCVQFLESCWTCGKKLAHFELKLFLVNFNFSAPAIPQVQGALFQFRKTKELPVQMLVVCMEFWNYTTQIETSHKK